MQQIKTLMESLNVLLEEQAHMTDEQVTKDRQKKLNVLRMGMEIEFFSNMRIGDTENYIKDVLGFDKWKCVSDLSVNDVRSTDPWQMGMIESPAATVNEYLGIDRDELLSEFIAPLGKGNASILGVIKNIYDEAQAAAQSFLSEVEGADDLPDNIDDAITAARTILDYTLGDTIDSVAQRNIVLPLTEINTIYQRDDIDDIFEKRDRRFQALRDANANWGDWEQSRYGRKMDRARAMTSYIKHYGEGEEAAKRFASDTDTFIDWIRFKYRNRRPEDLPGAGTKYGVEMKNDGPVSYRARDQYVDQVVTILNDQMLGAKFAGELEQADAGMHIHLGLSDNVKYNALDFLRLLINVVDSEDMISDAAGRPVSGDFRTSMGFQIRQFNNALDTIARGEASSWGQDTTKYMGYNIGNINDRSNAMRTIEFRWADSAICKNRDELINYLDLVESLLSDSFTGDNTFEYGNYILKEVNDKRESSTYTRINVFDKETNKYLAPLSLRSPGKIMASTSNRAKRNKYDSEYYAAERNPGNFKILSQYLSDQQEEESNEQ